MKVVMHDGEGEQTQENVEDMLYRVHLHHFEHDYTNHLIK